MTKNIRIYKRDQIKQSDFSILFNHYFHADAANDAYYIIKKQIKRSKPITFYSSSTQKLYRK